MKTLIPLPAPLTRARWLEIATVAVTLGGLIALQMVLTDALYLFQAHFWLDELFTLAIVSDPEVSHSLQALAGAVDTNPPLLHLLLRGFTALLGSQSEPVFRCFALLSMFAALLGIYLILREAFPPLPALVGVLAVWCHPLILRHAFEARFYGPWLAALVWYAYCLSRSLRSPRQLGWLAAVAVTSVLVCTIHYFGIITLILVAVAELLIYRPWQQRQLETLAALFLGPLALAACLPFFTGQRAALTVGSWNPPPDLLGALIGLAPILVVFCLYFLRDRLRRLLPANSDPGAVLGLLGLTLLTPALTLFSLFIQPATMARYILPTLAALAPVAAFVALLLPHVGRLGLCLVFVAGSRQGLHDLANLYRVRDRGTDDLIAALRALPADTPVVFEFTNVLYVIDHYAPDVGARCYFLDFESDQLEHASKHRITTRDVARQVLKFRGRPGLMTWPHFQSLPRRYLVPGEELQEPIVDSERRFPGFTLHQRQAGLYELTPAAQRSAAVSPARSARRSTASKETPAGG